jgi:peptidoglycan/LPS O-acetylase OafA/YrhL
LGELKLVDSRTGSATSARRFPLLDAARGIAAVAVMVYHYHGELRLGSLFGSAFLSVDLFFMMSGFVLSHAYESKLVSGEMSFRKFVAVRLIRLYPVYVMGSVIGLAYYASKTFVGYPNAPSLKSLLALVAMALTFIPNPDIVQSPAGIFPFAPSSWSLSTEMMVSIVYGLFLFRMRTKHVLIVSLLSLTVFLPFAYMHGTFDLGWGWNNFGYGILRTLSIFSLGVWLYRLSSRLELTAHLPAIVFLAAIAGCVVLLPPAGLAVALIIVFLVFAPFIVCQPVSDLTGTKAAFCEQLGRFSYPIYVLHTPVLLWTYAIAKQLHLDNEAIGRPFGFAEIVFTLLLSRAILAIDEPLRRALGRWIKRRTQIDNI